MNCCPHCQKQYDNVKAKAAHIKWCKLNPNRFIPFETINRVCEARTLLNERTNTNPSHIEKRKATLKERHATGLLQWKLLIAEEEFSRRKKISESMKKNPNAGGYRQGSGSGKKCWFDSKFAGRVFLDSSYELAYAKYLDESGIHWRRNTIKFPYEWEGVIRNYIPDVYLEDEEIFIEVKGYKTQKDEAKWKSFPYKLRVLFREDLQQLGILDGGTRGG